MIPQMTTRTTCVCSHAAVHTGVVGWNSSLFSSATLHLTSKFQTIYRCNREVEPTWPKKQLQKRCSLYQKTNHRLCAAERSSMEEQMIFDNLDEKLEDDASVITAKWLSIQFDYPIREAERLLSSYFEHRPHLSAVYLLNGIYADGEIVVQLVPDGKLREMESRFMSTPSRLVYSVQRQQCRSSTLASVEMLTNITSKSLKKLATIPWCPADTTRNPLVCLNNAVQDSKQPISPLIPKLSAIGKDAQIKTTEVTNFFTPTPKTTTTTVPTKRPVKRASNFFDVKPNKKQNSPEKIPANLSTGETIRNTVIADAGDDDDDDEFLTSAVSRSCAVKRKRIIVESDEENEPSPEPIINKSPNKSQKRKSTKEILVSDSETDSPAPKSRRSRKPPANDEKAPSPNHFPPSLQVKRSSPKSFVSPKKPAAPKLDLTSRRNPHRRQVLKTFTDEDGFMVTEKVWEGASDEEEISKTGPPTDAVVDHSVDGGVASNVPPVAAVVPANTTACLTGAPTLGISKPGRTAKADAKRPASKQASLSSFFKRG
ncbi:hypothetical protein EG68_03519 [Paragonimus skrjabini miyazakii]|uniref:DNA polymerase delta subunit 3 n=1 Tax=Paragonimus skrjabini miyazakii TaxID=59628 RepID=A0A8S9YTY1_9TREM|nr:hypothetical protein EG68_03519 [Paragonimus skrjabini miyazakii]